MKKIIYLMVLLTKGWLVYAQQGKPCLPKDALRTKEELVTELFKPENKNLLVEYRRNVSNLLKNIGELPLVNDADLKNIILKSEVLVRDDLIESSLTNGFKKPDGTIGYIKNDPVKEGYKYLSYKGVVYGALNCGNPIKVFLNEKDEVMERVVDTTHTQTTTPPATPPPPTPLPNPSYTSPGYVWSTPAYTPIPVGYSYPYSVHQAPPPPRPRVSISVGVGVQRMQQAPPQQVFVPVYRPVNYRPQTYPVGGPVTPSHGGYAGNPQTPVHTGSGGPVTPRK